MAREIDQWSEEPFYRQLAGFIRAQIQVGELEPGQKLPSEKDLMQEYGLARNTVRMAVALLAEEGYVQTVTRRGSRVRPREDWPQP